MIVVDYNQTAIGSFMAEVKGRTDVEPNLDLLRHMILNSIRSYKMKWGDEFGNLVIACDRGEGMCNSTRAVFNGGYPSNANGMDSIEFSSGGSGTSFGSDIEERGQNAGFCSDSHGGLGGY